MRINPDCPECNGRGYVELFLSSSPCRKCGPHAVTCESRSGVASPRAEVPPEVISPTVRSNMARHLEIESTLLQALQHSAAGVPLSPSMASKLANLAGQVLYGEGFHEIDVEAYELGSGYRIRASCEGHTFKLFVKPPTEEQVREMMIDKIASQHPEHGDVLWATLGPGGKSVMREGTRADYRRYLATLTTHQLRRRVPVEPSA